MMDLDEAIAVLKGYIENPLVNDTRAFELAIKALEQQPEWIPVSEGLPEDVVSNYDIRCSEDVLVYDGADLRVGYFVRSEKLDYGYWNIYGDDCFEPVAWMPLPKRYEAESEGKE